MDILHVAGSQAFLIIPCPVFQINSSLSHSSNKHGQEPQTQHTKLGRWGQIKQKKKKHNQIKKLDLLFLQLGRQKHSASCPVNLAGSAKFKRFKCCVISWASGHGQCSQRVKFLPLAALSSVHESEPCSLSTTCQRLLFLRRILLSRPGKSKWV